MPTAGALVRHVEGSDLGHTLFGPLPADVVKKPIYVINQMVALGCLHVSHDRRVKQTAA